MASQAALADLATLRAQVSQLIRNLEQPFFEATRKTVVIIALDKAMTSQNVNFASPHAASQMINNIENKVAGKLTAFTDDVNDTVSDLAAGRCTVIAALRVLGAIQAELQEMNQAIEVNRATVLNLLCGLSTSELEAIQGSVVIRQLFDEQFPGTLPVLVARQAQA